MTPQFVPFGGTAGPAALAIDGAVPGARATYSHWQGDHTTPPELAADTSTGMLVLAAQDVDRWLSPFSIVCNNHIDADGLLSLLAACRPDLARVHAARLIAAATAGDFSMWTGRDAYDLVLRVHQLIRTAQTSGSGWEQRCLETLIAEADRLLEGSWPGLSERIAALQQITLAIDYWQLNPPITYDRLAVVSWTRIHGRADNYNTIYRPDDVPLLALSTVIPPSQFQLLLEHTEAGVCVYLDAPRHSWARTVDLPTVAWPSCEQLAKTLRSLDSTVDWLTRPTAQALGFTCLLGSARHAQPAACRLSHDLILHHVIDACSNTM